MNYLFTIILIISLKEIIDCSTNPDCGIRLARRQPRNHQPYYSNKNYRNDQFFYNGRIPKIIAGSPTKEGQFPWQASLELLHPSLGFLGHWCGGVLIDENWVVSAAHCIHNDLFNLPLPPLWTVVLGEYDRNVESGYEQRIPVEKIVLHDAYHNFLHDLVLMKLSIPADLSKKSNIRKVCLPFIFDENSQSSVEIEIDSTELHEFNTANNDDLFLWDQAENLLQQIQGRNKQNFTFPSMKELMTTKITNRLKQKNNRLNEGRQILQYHHHGNKKKKRQPATDEKNLIKPRRRNDKLMAGFINDDYIDSVNLHNGYSESKHNIDEYKDLPYIDCVATGWGKSNISGDLTDILLKTNVPLHSSSRCKDAYGSFVKIHKGHLCAGKLNGRGGTCVGDSGGPLQCRLTKNGPWILAGITSFGSGCAIEGFPDVYTRTSYYMKWIRDTIQNE